MQLIEDRSRSAITEFIFGIRDINDDADWDAYKAELEASNLGDYLELMQTEYDRSWVGTMPTTYTPFPPRT